MRKSWKLFCPIVLFTQFLIAGPSSADTIVTLALRSFNGSQCGSRTLGAQVSESYFVPAPRTGFVGRAQKLLSGVPTGPIVVIGQTTPDRGTLALCTDPDYPGIGLVNEYRIDNGSTNGGRVVGRRIQCASTETGAGQLFLEAYTASGTVTYCAQAL